MWWQPCFPLTLLWRRPVWTWWVLFGWYLSCCFPPLPNTVPDQKQVLSKNWVASQGPGSDWIYNSLTPVSNLVSLATFWGHCGSWFKKKKKKEASKLCFTFKAVESKTSKRVFKVANSHWKQIRPMETDRWWRHKEICQVCIHLSISPALCGPFCICCSSLLPFRIQVLTCLNICKTIIENKVTFMNK